jgi:O-antigen/teichoic acid export membrane protein
MSAINPVPLKRRVMKAGLWSLGSFFFSSVVRFGSNLLLTRLLVPDMFGVMAVASAILVGLHMFSDVGIKQNIIQSARGNEPSFLNTAWRIQISRGVALFFIAICISGLISIAGHAGFFPRDTAYAAPSLPPVIAVMSITAIVAGFESTKLFEASRALTLGLVTRVEITSQIIGLVGTMTWVFFDRSIWSLVAGGLLASLARTILSHVWLPGARNRRDWDPAASHEIIRFGKWIFVSSVLGFFVNSGDRLLLGGMVEAKLLGQYVIASLFMASVEGILGKIMQEVSFPTFSEVVRERPDQLKKHYYKFHLVIAATAYFSAGMLITFGRSLIALLYDQRYAASGWMLQILAGVLVTVPFRLATESFLALGAPQLLSKVIILRLAAMLFLTPVGFYLFDLEGALWGIVLSHFSYIPMIVLYNLKHNLLDVQKEALCLAIIPLGLASGLLLSEAAHYLR